MKIHLYVNVLKIVTRGTFLPSETLLYIRSISDKTKYIRTLVHTFKTIQSGNIKREKYLFSL